MSDDSGHLNLEYHPFELREAVESTMAQFAGTAGKLDLISYLSEDCPAVVVGDVVRLRQVLDNLVGNAVKYTEHGDVLLQVQPDADQPDGEPATSGIRLRFTVADTGVGLSPERMARLAISQAIVEAMGGALTVTHAPGSGSEFTFGVLLGHSEDRRSVARPRAEAAEFAQLAGRNVLVVDDDEGNRRTLRRQLESYGLVCTASASPLDALALVSAGRSFDLAILHWELPMMDGAQLAMALRRLPAGRRLPLLLLSSIDQPHQDDAHLFAAVLIRPVHTAPLFKAIIRMLFPDADPGPNWRAGIPDQHGSWIAPPHPEVRRNRPHPEDRPNRSGLGS